jgi:hypothetical protein
MYHNTLGQQSTTSIQLKGEVPDWAAGTSAIIKSAAEPALEAYSIHMRNELNKERLKAGLPPLLPRGAMGVPQPPPEKIVIEKETFTIGGIALAVIIFLLISGKGSPKPVAKKVAKPATPRRKSKRNSKRKSKRKARKS